MTPVFCCGCECGVSGAHWTLTSATFDTTTVRSGARSIKVAAGSTSTIQIAAPLSFSPTVWVVRFYVYFDVLPVANYRVFYFANSVTTRGGVHFVQSNGSLAASSDGTNLGTGVAITAGVWNLVDLKIDITNNPWTADITVNGTAGGQATNAVAGSTITTMFGARVSSDATANVYYDDFVLSNTAGDYPIGAGHVHHFVPVSDGTHTATTTTIVKGTIATPVGANVAAATDVFNWVNGVPLLGGATDNTRLVNQQTAGITLYAEVKFGGAPGITTPTTAPRAVEVITADREATTATCDFTAKLNDNGTEGTIIARGVVAGVVTDRYATKQFATGPAGAWTAASSGAGGFNNLKARWGYASDATPDLYWRGIMVEAEFADVVANNNTTQFLMLMGAGT